MAKNRRMRARRKLKGLRKKLQNKKRMSARPFRLATIGRGFPDRLMTTLRYAQTFSYSASTGSLSTYQFGCNNLVAPNITQAGTGHQPYYFDQLAALYNQYTVIGSRISWTVTPQQTAEDSFRVCAYIEDDTTTTPTNLNTLMEQSRSNMRYFAPDSTITKTVKMKWSAKKAFGGSVLGNPDLTATTAGSPNLQQFFTLGIQGDGSATVDTHIMVLIDYIVIFNEKKIIATS